MNDLQRIEITAIATRDDNQRGAVRYWPPEAAPSCSATPRHDHEATVRGWGELDLSDYPIMLERGDRAHVTITIERKP